MNDRERYDDPVKQLSRLEQLTFEKRHLASVDRSKLRVVYLPGPNNYEWWIYERLGVPPQNAVGLESDVSRFKRLNKNSHGITVKNMDYQDYFKTNINSEGYNIISLDTESQLNSSFWDTLVFIFNNDLLRTPGVLVTNIYGQRERDGIKKKYTEIESIRRKLSNSDFINSLKVSTSGVRDTIDLNAFLDEVIDNPTMYRSNAISELIRMTFRIALSNQNSISKRAKFARNYFPHIEYEMKNHVNIFRYKNIGNKDDAILKFMKGDLSLENALLTSLNLRINFEECLSNSIFSACLNNSSMFQAICMLFFDQLFMTEHKRFQYTSKTRGTMYLDLVAVNRPSTSYVAPLLRDLEGRLQFQDGHFSLVVKDDEGHIPLRKFKKDLKKIFKKSQDSLEIMNLMI